jgi:hypothetical protein
MHTLLIVVAVVVGVPLIWLLRPGGGGLEKRADDWALRRNAEGKGNFMTKPLWGTRSDRRDSDSN